MELDEAIREVQAGNRSAYAHVVAQTERNLRAFLALRVPDRDLVDEVAHQAYITGYQKIREFTAGGSVQAWLKQIALHHLRNECRKRRLGGWTLLERIDTLIAPEPGPEEREELQDELLRLERCVRRLGPQAKKMVQMRYHEELEPAQMAKHLGQSASSIRTMLTRIRRALQECMEGAHDTA